MSSLVSQTRDILTSLGIRDRLAHFDIPSDPISLTIYPVIWEIQTTTATATATNDTEEETKSHCARDNKTIPLQFPLLNWPRPLNPPRSRLIAPSSIFGKWLHRRSPPNGPRFSLVGTRLGRRWGQVPIQWSRNACISIRAGISRPK